MSKNKKLSEIKETRLNRNSINKDKKYTDNGYNEYNFSKSNEFNNKESNNKIKHNNKSDNDRKILLKKIVIGVVTGIVNGLFGSGGGTIVVPAMILLLDLDEHKAHATAISIILPLTVISAIFYIKNSYVDWNITWKVIIGGMAGGYVGAKLLNICPASVLRKIFAGFMIFASIRMLWK